MLFAAVTHPCPVKLVTPVFVIVVVVLLELVACVIEIPVPLENVYVGGVGNVIVPQFAMPDEVIELKNWLALHVCVAPLFKFIESVVVAPDTVEVTPVPATI